MASTTTFLEATNEVLAAAGFSEIASGSWAAAIAEQRRAKRIVADCVKEMANNIPDQHWQHVWELTVLPVFQTGEVIAVADDTVTVSGVDLTTDAALYTAGHCLFRLGGESQWFKVLEFADATTITLRTDHPVYTAADPYPTAEQTAALDITRTFKLWQWRYALPANYRDIQDVYNPFQGVDVEPMGMNDLVRRALAPALYQESSEVAAYAIGSDQAVGGAPSTLSEAAVGPLIYLLPALQTDAKVYQLLYQRRPFTIDPDSDAADTLFDLPEDAMAALMYRAKMRGAIEIGRDAASAGFYRTLEQEQKQNLKSKETSVQDTPQIRGPGTMYGRHFRKHRIGRGLDVVDWD